MKLWPSSLFASMSNGNTAQKGVTILQAASTRPTLPLRWNQSWVSPISSPMLVSGKLPQFPDANSHRVSRGSSFATRSAIVLTIFDRR